MSSAREKEKELQYPLGETLPAAGAVLEVARGVKWLRMGLPFALDHINLWLVRDRIDGAEGWTVVDCGIADDATRASWERIFAHELDGLPVLRVIVTHMHPDHLGLAQWLTQRWNCRLWISATDWNAARMAIIVTAGFGGDSAADFFASHGLTDPDSVQKIRARANNYGSLVPGVPPQFHRLIDGMTIDIGGHAWRCIAGYGHAPEHISLHCADLRVLIAGDMLLPRISTNVSVIDLEPEANPLPMYLNSIDRFAPMPADTLVLPSHGRPFRGIQKRIAQLREHHDERLSAVLRACTDEPKSAADMLQVLFGRALDLHQTTFAMGESIAHLNALWQDGRVERRVHDDGIWRFRATSRGKAAASV